MGRPFNVFYFIIICVKLINGLSNNNRRGNLIELNEDGLLLTSGPSTLTPPSSSTSYLTRINNVLLKSSNIEATDNKNDKKDLDDIINKKPLSKEDNKMTIVEPFPSGASEHLFDLNKMVDSVVQPLLFHHFDKEMEAASPFKWKKIQPQQHQLQEAAQQQQSQPKLKTIMSLTEILEPSKRGHLMFDDLDSPFNLKDKNWITDPLNEFSRFISLMPKLNEFSFSFPTIMERNKRKNGFDHLFLAVNNKHNHHHINNKDKASSSVVTSTYQHNCQNNSRSSKQPSYIMDEDDNLKLIHEYDAETEQHEPLQYNESQMKSCVTHITKALPYLEGALGGVMIVLLVAVVVTWRSRGRPNNIWANIPFMEKSCYPEKV